LPEQNFKKETVSFSKFCSGKKNGGTIAFSQRPPLEYTANIRAESVTKNLKQREKIK